MESETTRQFHVLIIGAGTTGLLLAQGLKKAGISYTVYERESAEAYKGRQREWGMALHWAMESLAPILPDEILSRLDEARTDPFLNLTGEDAAIPLYDGKTGKLLTKVGGGPFLRVSRSKLRKLLSEGVEVKFGKNVVAFEDKGATVQARFQDGEEVAGNIVVGAEGSRSPTREFLLGDAAKAKKLEGAIFFNFTQRFDAETALKLNTLHPIMKFAYHPDGHGMSLLSIQDRQDHNDPSSWLFQIATTWATTDPAERNADAAQRVVMLRERAKLWPDPWRTAALAVKDDTFIPKDTLSYWEPIPWDNRSGKVTLAGDAAHPMMPHRGQGLNNALEDAARLVDALTSVALSGERQSEAIGRYEEEMIARGGDEVRRSNQQCAAALDFSLFMESPVMKLGLQKVPPPAKTTTTKTMTEGEIGAAEVVNVTAHAHAQTNAETVKSVEVGA